jgi:PAS domain S-box-containing protein
LAVERVLTSVDNGGVHTQSRVDNGVESDAIGDIAPNALLSLVLDHTTDGVLMVDARGAIVYANQPLLDLFGYEAGDLVGQTIGVLVPDGHRAEHQSHVERFNHSQEERPMGRPDLDIEGRRSDGSCFSVDVQLSALPGSSLTVATVRDMTEQRQAAVDSAIARIDLANATTQVDDLQASLDLVIQRLFALGTSIAAGATNESVLAERMETALQSIDEIIELIQQQRHPSGPFAGR